MKMFRVATLTLLGFLSLTVSGVGSGEDYVRDVSPSAVARASFAAVPTNLAARTVFRRAAQQPDEDGAYFTEDGAISIPSGAMVMFRGSGKCMDPHLPAPCGGEPMQFVSAEKLIPRQLRDTYDTLLKRAAAGDPEVSKNNLQHLVWALRTAGMEDPLVNSLSDAQKDLLDDCSGRRNGFTRYHERTLKRNAKKGGRVSQRIAVGDFSYDASELSGTNGARIVQTHIDTLTEMGEKATERSSMDLRYGEIDDELYTDVECAGGLSYTARILNASGHRKEFKASEFAAQVGNGSVAGSCRQRVTMVPPDEFVVVMGAAQEGVEVDQDISIAEIDGTVQSRRFVRTSRRRTARTRQERHVTEKTKERTKRERKSETTTITEVLPVPPVPPVSGIVTVTNEIAHPVSVPEPVKVCVVSLAYDTGTRTGVLTVEIVSGAFKSAHTHIRQHFDALVRKEADPKDAVKIPADTELEITAVSINGEGRCEVKFEAK